jgi:hypothetical protein
MRDYRCSRCGRVRYSSTTKGHYDCLEKEPPFYVGQKITVKAWWRNNKPTPCIVEKYSDLYDSLDVRPLIENPHGRYIHSKDVIPEKDNYREEMGTA